MRVTGAAGGSAQAEYERRSTRREQKVRDAHPLLGGLILALSDEPQHVAAWRRGAAGERAVARRLDQLVARGVEVLHDRRIPDTKANIDHIAVSSSGVYVIDAKNYTGTVRVDWEGGLLSPRRYKLTVGRRDATKLVTSVQRQVQLVRDALAGDPRLPDDVAVTGVLAFFDADWPFFPPDRIEDVRLEGPKSTTKLILRDGPYTAWGVPMIAERLRTQFPEA
ncbi:nuclease-related domain-containing protein [Blastococcus sp. SYSU DS0753]